MFYDVMHFEALGEEAKHIEEVTEKMIAEGKLPNGFKYLITPNTVQEYLAQEPTVKLPEIITTKTHSILPDDYVNTGEKKSVITRSAGYDHFEHLQYKINLTSLREYCVDAVSQTAIKFMYCVAGNLNEYTKNTEVFERKNTRSFRELNENVIVVIYGLGKIGHQTYKNAVAAGVKTLAVDIREDELKQLPDYADVKFVSPEEAIKSADIIINVMNLTKNKESRFYNEHYFTEEYLNKASKPLLVINVTRGEIFPESVVMKLYEEGRIIGFATDVFSHEAELTDCLRKHDFSACKDEDILAAKRIIEKAIDRTANFYVQPHQGFNSDIAAMTKAEEAMRHVAYWFSHGRRGFVEQLPYYN
jgi:hypothetical protein